MRNSTILRVGILVLASFHIATAQSLEEKRLAFEKAEKEYVEALQAEMQAMKAKMAQLQAALDKLGKPPVTVATVAEPPAADKNTKKISIKPSELNFVEGETAKITMKLDGKDLPPSKDLHLSDPALLQVKDKDLIVSAPKKMAPNVEAMAFEGKINVLDPADPRKLLATGTIPVRVEKDGDSEWESRAIMGFHQAGASSAASTQNAFFDFFIQRGLGNHRNVYDAKVNLWGNVRVASSPRQISVPIAQFAAGFATKLGEVPVNEMAQSAEFITGLGYKLAKYNQGGGRIRMLEAVAFFGGNGSLSDPFTQGAIFRRPNAGTPSRAEFDGRYKINSDFIALTPPDRERFYRSYGGGFRLSTFETRKKLSPPGSYMVTLGQDQLITSGFYQGPVLRFDVFYPLPIGNEDGRWKSVFLFGTANMRLQRPGNGTPLAMERMCTATKGATDPATPANSNCSGLKRFFDPDVTVVGVASSRDTYRMGIGIDFVNLLRSWPKPAATPTKE
jgi:hypothetical protein